jgi:hypothetical protein
MATNNKRPSFTQVMTPKGTLVWPKLDQPDEYKGKKSYSAKIRLSPEDSQKLIAKIEAELDKFWPVAKAELEQKLAEAKTGPEKAKARKALEEMAKAEPSYKPAYDDDGNETGEYEFNFKMPDHFVGKDKQPVFIKPDVFDAKGKKMKVVPEVWGGTKAIVAGEFRPFSMPIGVGISLRLKAVQIIELAEKGGDRSASSYGFGQHEGYENDSDEDDNDSGGFEDQSGGDSGSDQPTDF